MKRMTARLLVTAFVPLLAAATGGFAQQTNPTSSPLDPGASSELDSEIVELSPFNVDSSSDIGYQAGNTLAGTRLRTELKDIAAPVQVLTREFLDDTSATDLEDILVYATNTETPGLGGNFSAGTQGSGRLDFDGGRVAPQSSTRVRGLAAADLTQNFFQSDIPVDTFNTERIEINRGPNAILFGLGSAGGIVNATLNRAQFTNRGEVRLEYGRFGSHRETLDLNRVLIEDKLAVRFDFLNERQKFEQEFTFEEDRRYYGDVAFRPLKWTTIRVNASAGDINANRPRIETPTDRLTRWWKDGKWTWDTARDFSELDRSEADSAGNSFRDAAIVFSDPASSSPFAQYDAVQAALFGSDDIVGDPAPFTSAGFVTTLRTSAAAPLNPDEFGGPGPAGYFFDESITDRSIFDYRRKLLEGPNKAEWGEFETFNIVLEQRSSSDTLGFELAYDRQNWENGFVFGGSQRGQGISIDANDKLYDGSPNPNFGRPYVLSADNIGEGYSDRETFRATAFGDLNLPDMLESDLGWWLGRHVFTGLYSDQSLDREDYGFRSAIVDPSFGATYHPGFGQQNDITADGSGATAWRYLGSSLADLSSPVGANITGVTAVQRPGDIANGFFYNPATNSMEAGRPVDVTSYWDSREDTAISGSALIRDINTWAVIAQSFFVGNHVVLTSGWRRDEVDQSNVTARKNPVTNGVILGDFDLPDEPDIALTEDIFSWGVVAHGPDFLNRMLPWESTISAHYSESENFDAESAGIDIFGNELGTPGGSTKEMGFTVDMFDGRLVARVNFFETEQTGSRIGIPGPGGGSFLLGIATRVYQFNALADIQAAGWVDPPQDLRDAMNWRQTGEKADGTPLFTFDSPSAVGMQETQDVSADGTEIEIIVNPSSNWRLAVNVGEQVARQSNTAPTLAGYIEERSGIWFDPAIGALKASPGPAFTVARRAREQVVNPYLLAAAQDGGPVQELRQWRLNIITNYEFNDGPQWLQGFGIGGAIRWQDSAAVGFPIIEPETGLFVPDVDNPFYGSEETNIDAWITYKTRLFDRIGMQLRLHVKNLNSGNDLIPVRANPDGNVAQYRMQEPMLWTLSSTFTF